jgi:hypothetical protein
MIKLFLVLVCSICLSGCSIVRLTDMLLDDYRYRDVEERNAEINLKSLLEDGWQFFIYKENKVLLIKYTDTGMLIKDVFGVLNES